MYKGIELRIYPNKKQKELIAKTFGCTRLIYNKALDLHKSKYENEGITIFYKDTNEMLTSLKKDEDFKFLNYSRVLVILLLYNNIKRFKTHLL